MLMSQQYPGQFLKCADLQGQNITMTVQSVAMEKVGDDEKPVIHFYETQQGFVVNKTNATLLVAAYGDESAAWVGRRVTLTTVQTNLGPGIGVQIPTAAAAVVPAAVAPGVLPVAAPAPLPMAAPAPLPMAAPAPLPMAAPAPLGNVPGQLAPIPATAGQPAPAPAGAMIPPSSPAPAPVAAPGTVPVGAPPPLA